MKVRNIVLATALSIAGLGGVGATALVGASEASASCVNTTLTGPAGTYGTGPFGTIVVSNNAAIFNICLGYLGSDSTMSVNGVAVSWNTHNCYSTDGQETDCDLLANGHSEDFQASCKNGKFYMDWYDGFGYLAAKNYWANPYNLLVAGAFYTSIQHGNGFESTDGIAFGNC